MQHGTMHFSLATMSAISSGRGGWLAVCPALAVLLPTCLPDGGLRCQCVQASKRDVSVFLEVGAWFTVIVLGGVLCIPGRLSSIGRLSPTSCLSSAGAGFPLSCWLFKVACLFNVNVPPGHTSVLDLQIAD